MKIKAFLVVSFLMLTSVARASTLDDLLSAKEKEVLKVDALTEEQRKLLDDILFRAYMIGKENQATISTFKGYIYGSVKSYDGMNFVVTSRGQTYKIPYLQVLSIQW